MGFDNTAYGGQYPQQQQTPYVPPPNTTTNHLPPSYEQSMIHHNNINNNNINNGLDRNSSMNASFTSTSSTATTAQSMSDSFIKNHQLENNFHPKDQAYDTGMVNLRPNTAQQQPQPTYQPNQYYVPPQQPYQPPQQQQTIPPHLQNQVVYPNLNQPPQQQPYPMNNHYIPPHQPTLPPLPQKTQPITMNYQKPNTIPQHMPQPVIPMQQPMPQRMIPQPQPVMMTPQPMMVSQRTVTHTYNNTPVHQPVFVTSPMVSQVPGRTTVVTTTTQPGNVRVVHGPPPSMPSGAVGYSAYYPQHSAPVSQTTVYVQQKKKKSLFDKIVHGE